jgi:hypothetical protein
MARRRRRHRRYYRSNPEGLSPTAHKKHEERMFVFGAMGLAVVGTLGYILYKNSSTPASTSASGGPAPANASDQALAASATQYAQNFNAQAQQLGLSSAQAQDAYNQGMTPAQYAQQANAVAPGSVGNPNYAG